MRRIVIGQLVVDWVGQRLNSRFFEAAGIGMEQDGELVAGVVYNEFNGSNINMHVAAVGKHWMNKRYLSICFDYPFNQLRVKRITALVEASNTAAIRFVEHLGFEYEARLTDAAKNGDLLIFKMRREHCRWIEQLKLAA